MAGGRKAFFFERKKQKTFGPCRRVLKRGATGSKSFLVLFFKKGLLACLACLPAAAHAQTRQVALLPPATRAEFTSYAMGLWPITGHFTRFTGQLQVDPAHAQDCTVTLNIDVSSLEMADPERARTATGPKLLDAPQFPTLTYQGSCAGGRAAGLLTMHGVTRKLELTARRTGQVVTAFGTLHRQDYGIDGLPGLIGRTVKLTFAVSLPDDLAALVDP